MSSVLHPVGDGVAVGDLQVVGGVERFAVLSPALGDDDHIAIDAHQGAVFDQRLQARGPIALGDGALRGRFARLAGDGGIEVGVGLWRTDPRRATSAADLIAEVHNFTVWQPSVVPEIAATDAIAVTDATAREAEFVRSAVDTAPVTDAAEVL